MSNCCGKPTLNERKHEPPIPKEGGVLLFKKVAPTLPGYVHDAHNPKLLRPDKVPCDSRITLPLLGKHGKYTIVNRCNHIDCGQRGKDVNDDICSVCLFRNLPSAKSPTVAVQ